MMQHRLPPEAEVGVLPPNIGIPVGQRAPNATVVDTEGHEVQILDLTRKGPILLVFYRGGWCPFCNFQIHELTAALPGIREARTDARCDQRRSHRGIGEDAGHV